MRRHHRTRPRRDERGVALVEFCLVCVLLFTLLLGIISLGLVLSVKQTATHAVSEGARAVVGVDYSHVQDDSTAKTSLKDTRKLREAALAQTNQTLVAAGRSCPPIPADSSDALDRNGTEPFANYSPALVSARLATDGIACQFIVTDCATTEMPTQPYDTYNNSDDCITVTVILDNDKKPLVPPIPLISYLVPTRLVSSATVHLGAGSHCPVSGAKPSDPLLCRAQ